MFNVRLAKFEGPLDLLLQLIEDQKLDITRISLATVADDYLEFIRSEENIGLENLAEFVNTASKIILIKSRSILPTLEVTPREEREIKDLEEQLKLYKRFKEAADKVRFLLKNKDRMYSRDYLMGVSAVFSPPKDINAFDLKKTFQSLASRIVLPEKLPEETVRGIITLEDKISELQKTLQERIEIGFSQLKSSAKDRVEVIVSFLALLELVKQRIVSAEQSGIFSDIKIKHATPDQK